jgi:hypothetical protein
MIGHHGREWWWDFYGSDWMVRELIESRDLARDDKAINGPKSGTTVN